MNGGRDEQEWLLCSRTKELLAEVDGVLAAAIAADDVQLRIMASHVIERGGKRLRPALLLLSASFGTCDRDELLRAAAAVELTHVASLYHDDVMDRAALRRSGATTNARWGNAAASFAGTYLFARAGHLWASVGAVVNELASRAAVELCIGQLREIESAYDLDQDEAAHLCVLEQKTATLFEMPCRVGSVLCAASVTRTEALAAYGRALGVAFQLVDDALDLTGDAAQIRKGAANDLREGIYSLAVLRALGRSDVRDRLRAVLSQVSLDDADVELARQIVVESGAVAEVLDDARACARRAKVALATMPDGPAVRSLYRLADYAVERSH